MASIAAIRNAIESKLDDIDGWHAYDTAVGSERAPALIVFPAPGGGKETSNTWKRMFVVEAHAPLSMGLARCQDALDDLIYDGSTSNIESILEADKTLGGVVDYCVAHEFTDYGFARLNETDTLMLRVPLEVMHT